MLFQCLVRFGVGVRLFWLCCLLWCSPAVTAKAALALAELNPPLRVVLEISPPHQTWQQGEVGGLTTILVRQLLTELQLSPVFEVYPWES